MKLLDNKHVQFIIKYLLIIALGLLFITQLFIPIEYYVKYPCLMRVNRFVVIGIIGICIFLKTILYFRKKKKKNL